MRNYSTKNAGLKRLAKYAFAALVVLCIAFASSAASSKASMAYADEADGEQTTYTVTVRPGNQGTLNSTGIGVESDSASINYSPTLAVISNLHYGDRINFDNSISNLGSDSKYYAKGIRVSGLDNITAENVLMSVEVTGDEDYVVAYGLKGQLVEYTVRYLGPDGNPLADDNVYVGNAGDMPVVAHLYFDGYRPQAYNLTGTLSANPEENVFVFQYEAIEQPSSGNNPNSSSSSSSASSSSSQAATGEGNDAEGEGGADEGADIQDEQTPAAEPEELINIDNGENPLDSGTGALDTSSLMDDGSAMVLAPIIATGVILVLGVALIIAWAMTRRRSKKEEENASQSNA